MMQDCEEKTQNAVFLLFVKWWICNFVVDEKLFLPERVELVVVPVGGEVVHQDLLPVLLRVRVNDRHVHI